MPDQHASRENGKKGGRPKGSKSARTLERDELLRQFRERVAAEFAPLADALFLAARGVSHMMARDRNGTWTEVTDPAVMARVLNSGETFYRIYARNPDMRALKDIFDRMFGCATQAVEMNVKGEVELVERLAAARKRVKG